jgi:hypothetical protein
MRLVLRLFRLFAGGGVVVKGVAVMSSLRASLTYEA